VYQESATGIRIIPPLLLLAAIAAAFVANSPLPLHLALPALVRWPLGVALIVLPLAAMPSVFSAFRRAGSQYDVRKVPQGLVTDGPFRYSRNPGYLASIILGIGLGVVFDNGWAIVMMVPYAVIVHSAVVLKEELILERTFGRQYLDYKLRVRRWL
jgi:protein-S-isoprenylcysteine O-methyltransferase Ste14